MKLKHCGKEEFLKLTGQKKIFLFGASQQPIEMWKEIMRGFRLDITERISGIVDNNEKRWGESYDLCRKDYVIGSPESLEKVAWDQHVILITTRFYVDVIKQISSMQGLEDAEVFVWACLVLDAENTEEDKYEMRFIQEGIDQYEEWMRAAKYSKLQKEVLRKEFMTKVMKPGYRLLPRVAVMHSDICSLKCENCCDLIPQVKKNYYIPAQKVIEETELLLTGVDTCTCFDLTDGEALLYKELDTLLEYALNHDKIETVFVFSNATILPKESTLRLMQHPRFWIAVSDYGMQDRLDRFCELMDKYHINYEIQRDQVWKDFQVHDLKKRDESREILRYDFLRCCNRKCSKAYINRRLYACMPAFRMSNLGIYNAESDFAEIDEKDTPDMIWKKIMEVSMKDYINACDYCHFEDTAATIIRAGS